jgi:hypothetical protein
MSYSIYDNTMYDNKTSTVIGPVPGPAPSPVYTVTAIDNTSNGSLYWGMNGTSASPGQVYTTNGTSTGWANISLAEPDIKGATLKVNGDADFEGEVTIQGKSLTGMLEKIEERLAILHPNPKLEDKWDELKELGKRYKELEAEIIEKEKVWAILKK